MLLTFKLRLVFGYLVSIGLWLTVATQHTFGFGSNDQAITSTIWALAGAGLTWFGLSLVFWAGSPAPGSRLERFTFPGSQAIAKGVFVATMATTAACGTSDAPVLTYVGEATSTSATIDKQTTSAADITPLLPSGPIPIDDSLPIEIDPSDQADPEVDPTENELTETTPSDDLEALHTVVHGEHLWSIAIDHLAQDQSDPTTSEIASYWRRLVDENRPSLSSGDPNLIFPGEVLIMPE